MDCWTLRGVIFDMDGTLTVPVIDFAEMRRRLGIPDGDILAVLRSWPAERRAAAFAVIEEIEDRARAELRVQPGAPELLAFLDDHGILKGVITRNTEKTVRHFEARVGHRFSEVVSRDFEPVKPDPASAVHICRKWGLPPEQVLMVGDYRYDILCGRQAGTRTCLLRNEKNGEYEALADFAVDDLHALRQRIAAAIA